MAVVGCVDAGAVVVPAGHNRRTGRRTHRRLCVKASEIEAVGRHFVEMWRTNVSSAIKTNITPAKIIAHDQDHVGFLTGFGPNRNQYSKDSC